MKILLLGPPRDRLENHVRSLGDDIINIHERLSADSEILREAGFMISYGYRHIIGKDVLDLFPGKAINLHISLLPWNRGADPNLWSFLEDTPKGVSIHLIDEGIDTGPILAQIVVDGEPDDTLRTSYDRLTVSIEDLFVESWEKIRTGEIAPSPHVGQGSYHRLKDKDEYEYLLTHGWDTPVKNLIGKAIKGQGA